MAEGEVPMGQATPPDLEDKAVSEAETKEPKTPVWRKPAASPKAKSPKAKAKGKGQVKGKGKNGPSKRPAASEETTKLKKKPAAHGWAAGLQDTGENEEEEAQRGNQGGQSQVQARVAPQEIKA